MKKQNKTKFYIAVILLAILTFLVMPTTSNASLQSRPDATESLTQKTASEFFLLSREMETSAGPMGLNADISVDSNNKVVETTASNNIDIHMTKNTEYGTAAMLAASAYGNSAKSLTGTVTTTRK